MSNENPIDSITWRRVKQIFSDALEKPAAERLAFLDEQCEGDAQLRSQVEILLAAHSEGEEFMASPTQDVLGGPDPLTCSPGLADGISLEGPGTQIGRYKLLQLIGEGGFGSVYMAEQREPVVRRVSLKIIKLGMDSRQIIARFEAERQALAMMDHPNIAKVLDAGTTPVSPLGRGGGGRPYFVMELVKGRPITQYCDEKELTTRERLELFVSVCQAVQHAHQKGIIHRDLKPSNVLVAEYDDQPVAKVIDFGVAKALNHRLTEHTVFTELGQIVGTLDYMSPEQAKLNQLDVDTRSDIYSLGVLLYELLAGNTPFDKVRLHNAALDEVLRIIREEEPKRPSLRVSTSEALPAIASRRKIEPEKLGKLIRGELDWIVMKALEKDRTRRYGTASDLAADLGRFLKDEPVAACPPSTSYRLRKFVRRNTMGVIAVTALAAVVATLGIAGSFIWKSRVELERQQWAREYALPEIHRLTEERHYSEAFDLAEEAELAIPGDPSLARLRKEFSCSWSVVTEPSGARVFRKKYGSKDRRWEYLGSSPIESSVLARGVFRWKLVKDGYETAESVAGPSEKPLRFRLDRHGAVPDGMVRVAGGSVDGQDFADFFIDRHEVTNQEFKHFVDQGGYEKQEYWKHPVLRAGKTLSWEEAREEFLDATGKNGPATWRGGSYPPGEADFPVRGVSWYEAAAYAEFAGKNLPTIHHWKKANGFFYHAQITSASNLNAKGPAAVGTHPGVGPYGTYDMAGNVKEWCWNQAREGQRYLAGGAWNDLVYSFSLESVQPALDRSETNGFRCVEYLSSNEPPAELLAAVRNDYSWLRPGSEADFDSWRRDIFSYENRPLKPEILERTKKEKWVEEKVSFGAGYGEDRVIAYLFLPRHTSPPYQGVIYWPYAGSDELQRDAVRFLIEGGRAVVYPVYKGLHERAVEGFEMRKKGPLFRDVIVQQLKDFLRCLDYIVEHRTDIDRSRLAYYGNGMGGVVGPMALALDRDERIKAAVFQAGGLPPRGRPPAPYVNPVNFAPRMKTPVLMLNGLQDRTSIHLFKLIGTSESEKKLWMIGYGHGAPGEDVEREALAWLDHYLGRVEQQRR